MVVYHGVDRLSVEHLVIHILVQRVVEDVVEEIDEEVVEEGTIEDVLFDLVSEDGFFKEYADYLRDENVDNC